MGQPKTVSYRNLDARITYSEKDNLFHGYWNIGGERGKRASRTFEGAKRKTLDALKLIHKGVGEATALSSSSLKQLLAAGEILKDAGFANPLQVASEYVAIKGMASGENLHEVIRFWQESHHDIKHIPFKDAAWDWFNTRQSRWSKTTRDNHERRLRKLEETFQCDAADLTFESVRFYFQNALRDKSPKTRNHFRETLRSIIRHCVERCWIKEKHGLGSLLKNEKVILATPAIITPEVYKAMLQGADKDLLPIVALMGFCGIRRSEAMRLSWEDVWGMEGHVVLNSAQTKTSQRRHVERCTALEEWLKPYLQCTGAIWNFPEGTLYHRMTTLRRIVGISDSHNALRHSYCSYKLAITQKPEELAYQMGNSPQIIKRHYLKLVDPAQARQWFLILPDNLKPNVVQVA